MQPTTAAPAIAQPAATIGLLKIGNPLRFFAEFPAESFESIGVELGLVELIDLKVRFLRASVITEHCDGRWSELLLTIAEIRSTNHCGVRADGFLVHVGGS